MDCKVFRKVSIEHLWNIIHNGEMKYGRIFIIKEYHNEAELYFIRFKNKRPHKQTFIGY